MIMLRLGCAGALRFSCRRRPMVENGTLKASRPWLPPRRDALRSN
jgi:hypothetical protein